MTRRDDSLIGQVVAANVVLFALTLLAASLAAGLDLGASNERWQFLILALAIVLTLCVNLWMLQRRFRPLEHLIDRDRADRPAEPAPLELRRDEPGRGDRPPGQPRSSGCSTRIEEERRRVRPARHARAGGGAPPARARPPRRGQPGAHRDPAAPRGARPGRPRPSARRRSPSSSGSSTRRWTSCSTSLASCARRRSTTTAWCRRWRPSSSASPRAPASRCASTPAATRTCSTRSPDGDLPRRPGGAHQRRPATPARPSWSWTWASRTARRAARARRRRRLRPGRARRGARSDRRARPGRHGRARPAGRRRARRALGSRRRHHDHAEGAAMIRVLIADDHGIVRSGLRMLIDRQTDMEVVAEADDGVAALESTQSRAARRGRARRVDAAHDRPAGRARDPLARPEDARAAALDARRRALLPRGRSRRAPRATCSSAPPTPT